MYEKPELVDGDLISVIVIPIALRPAAVVHHVCVGNKRLWCTDSCVSAPGFSDTGSTHYPPLDLTDHVKWDEAEGIFYIN